MGNQEFAGALNMNPNRVTLLQMAKEKVNANLQLPIELLATKCAEELPYILNTIGGGFTIYGPTDRGAGELVELPESWTGLAYTTKSFDEKWYWLITKCKKTDEIEYNCLGAQPTPAEALKAAVEAVHRGLIHWQAEALRQTDLSQKATRAY